MINITTHIQQSRPSSCGAATLSMVYQFWGKAAQSENVIWDRLKVARPAIPNTFFMRTLDMARDSKKQGMSYFWGITDLTSPETAFQPINEFLTLGVPVVVCQQISTDNKLGHFRVVTAISERTVSVNDPMESHGTTMAIQDFLKLWGDASNGEVIGGEFFAIFPSKTVHRSNAFSVRNFESDIRSSFTVSNLQF